MFWVSRAKTSLAHTVQAACGGLFELAGLSTLAKAESALTSLVVRQRVHDGLVTFDLPPKPFLSLLGSSRALASGSFVFWMARSPDEGFVPGDLDLYVPEETYGILVDGLSKLRYRLLDADDSALPHYADCHRAIKQVEVFGTDKGSTYLNVITVAGDDPRVAIFLFHSTAVMNYMDSKSITIAYPWLTLNNKSLTNEWNKTPLPKRQECWDKYRTRGVTFFSSCSEANQPPHVCAISGHACYSGERSVDDGHSMTLVFDRQADATPSVGYGSVLRWHLALPGIPESGYVWTPSEVFILGPKDEDLRPMAAKARFEDALQRLRREREAKRKRMHDGRAG
ncbi:hypothetical protein BKA70DRAFT_91017 [Coprinopsis sp. MPI-PUGE-AT-0042]|nr:hypothetical protein BKA70DRAFT_91017 [Coprinopsis sp. MPI-PUGE-AT-0042]